MQYDESSETDEYSLSEGEKADIFKQYGFDGLFDENGAFNAARAIEEDNRIENQPIALNLGPGKETDSQEDEYMEEETASYESEEEEETPAQNAPQQQKATEQKKYTAPKPLRVLDIKTPDSVVSAALNRLSETTVIEVADILVKYPIQDCAVAILGLLRDLDAQSCLLPTMALLLFSLKTLMSLSDYR